MRVELTYFRDDGLCRGTAAYETEKTVRFSIWAEVIKRAERGDLPDLPFVDTNWIVLANLPDGSPFLHIPRRNLP